MKRRTRISDLRLEIKRLEVTVEALNEDRENLLESIKTSHMTGCWGPIEDAYSQVSLRPALRHRFEIKHETRLRDIELAYAAGLEEGRLVYPSYKLHAGKLLGPDSRRTAALSKIMKRNISND